VKRRLGEKGDLEKKGLGEKETCSLGKDLFV